MVKGPTDNPQYVLDGELNDTNEISPSTIAKRSFNPQKDAWRTFLVGGDIQVNVGDVELGAVEIKDHNSTTRLDVEPVFNYNAMLTVDAVLFQKTKVNMAFSTLVAAGATVTIVSYTVPTGKTFTFKGGMVSGNGQGLFEFEINNSPIGEWRNSGAAPSAIVRLPEDPEVVGSGVASITVTNQTYRARTFSATLSGYYI